MTQEARILDYLDRFGSITPMEAFSDLGITKLATRVSCLTRKGINIEKEWTTGSNRFGEPVRYMKYRKGE